MTPSEVRDHIGRQHIQLRILFVEIEHACRDCLAGGALDPRPLILKLVRAVSDHLTVEDRLLLPALRQLDGWGAVRASRAALEHAQQREQLTVLRTLARRGGAAEASRAARALVADLMLDMDREEHDLLGPDLLRDDPITIDQSDG